MDTKKTQQKVSPDFIHGEQGVGIKEGIVWNVVASHVKQPWN